MDRNRFTWHSSIHFEYCNTLATCYEILDIGVVKNTFRFSVASKFQYTAHVCIADVNAKMTKEHYFIAILSLSYNTLVLHTKSTSSFENI